MMYAAARDPSVMFTEPSEQEWGSVVDSKHTSLFGGSCGIGLDDFVYGRWEYALPLSMWAIVGCADVGISSTWWENVKCCGW
jgi:hypothetical protein